MGVHKQKTTTLTLTPTQAEIFRKFGEHYEDYEYLFTIKFAGGNYFYLKTRHWKSIEYE